ncbi:MAG: bifunctional lysylphosphatidylglycerol flippase/synthetase MprF [Solirubrobacterales bacterium]|nr:phosphatidylglycerol lysyltransferase domain-containing protein [Solirubrobacterales bacterium]
MNRRFGSWRRGLTAAATGIAGGTTVTGQLSGALLAGRHHGGGLSLLPLHALGIAGGAGLLVLAAGLWRGKRRAAEVSIAALCMIAAARLVHGMSPIDVGIDVGAALFILLNLSAFPSGSGRWSSGGITDTLALASGASLYALYAVAAVAATEGTEVDRVVASAGRHLPAGAIIAGTASHPGLVLNAAIAVSLVCGWAMLRALLRPAAPVRGHDPAGYGRAAAIVREHGTDSLDPFTLREDKSFHFAAGGFVAYRVLRETAVVSGDPVGPPGSAAAVLESFVRFAQERGWNVVVTAASDRHLQECKRLGLRVLRIGDEAVVDPRRFSLEGRPIRKVRQSIARIKRQGWRVEVVGDRDLTPRLKSELAAVESDWRSRQRRLIGFAMTLGRLAGAEERDMGIYVLGRDAAGRLRSFLRFASYRGGLSLDLMRRAGDEPNGLTEALVVAAIEHAKALQLGSVSLNFAGFAHVMAADAALSRSQRLLRLLLRLFHGRFQLERLVRFNAKFLPAWQPRYLVYDGLTYLPLSALRVLQAEAYLSGPDEPRRAGFFRGAPAWVRGASAAAAICVGLTASTALVGTHATARPLHIRAEVRHSDWSFVYGRPGDRTTERSLYLPKDRPVILRIVRQSDRSDRARSAPAPRTSPKRTIRMDPLHRGVISVQCGSCRSGISADVLGPKRFRSQLEAFAAGRPGAGVHPS